MQAVDLTIDQLTLDIRNPRIEEAQGFRDALQKVLVEQGDKLGNLAESIVEEGLSPLDRLLVIAQQPDEGSGYITLEGNRRLAAMKLMVSPAVMTDLVMKPGLRKKFEALAAKFVRAKVEPIACVQAPTREIANRWIERRHVGENEGRGVVGWSGLQALRFKFGDAHPALQALDFVKGHGELTPEQQGMIGMNFPITTLDRLLASRPVRSQLGFDVQDRQLRSALPSEELVKPLRKIVLDLAEKRIKVSQLKDKDAQLTYLKKFSADDKPDLKKAGEVRLVSNMAPSERKGGGVARGGKAEHGTGAEPASGVPTKKPRISDPTNRTTVVPRGTRLNIQNGKAAEIFKELRGLKLEKYPNAIAVLLRVFLELSVDHYLESNGSSPQFDHNGTKRDKTLHSKVDEVVKILVTSGLAAKDFTGVKRGLTDPRHPLHVDLLHAYVHNRFVTPKTRELTIAWDDATRFFEGIWK